MVESMNRVLRMQRQMHQELEREPTLDELAERCGSIPIVSERSCASRSTRCRSTRRWARRTIRTSPTSSRDLTVDAPADMADEADAGQAVEEALGE
jgi:RNA polymerase primary sigma factor